MRVRPPSNFYPSGRGHVSPSEALIAAAVLATLAAFAPAQQQFGELTNAGQSIEQPLVVGAEREEKGTQANRFRSLRRRATVSKPPIPAWQYRRRPIRAWIFEAVVHDRRPLGTEHLRVRQGLPRKRDADLGVAVCAIA